MKKLVLILTIALIAAPSFGVLNFTLERQGVTNKVDLKYADANALNLPRGIAFTIGVSGGAQITAISGYKTGVSTAASPGYGIYPATIVIDANGNVTSWGTPLAASGDPGAGDQILPSSNFVVEFGSLYSPVTAGVDANAPLTSGTLATFDVDCNGATGNINITAAEEDTYRGGVVLEDGTAATIAVTPLVYACAAPECYAGMPDYAQWADAGKPECWCYKKQCHGDADGLLGGSSKTGFYAVGALDLNILQGAWQIKNPPFGPGVTGTQGCADFDHLLGGSSKTGFYRVGALDLNILQTNWQIKEPPFGPGVPGDCLPGNKP